MKKFILFLILILAGVFRFYNNTAIALWHDEAFSALYIKYSWSEMLDRIILDVHPPLYYYVLRFWAAIFGDSLLSLRGMSILFGVLTVWAGYLLAKKAFKSENIGLLAALFLAINPFQIQYALEARMYTLGTFLALFSSWVLLKALDSRSKKTWLFFGLLMAASLYTHYYLLFSVAAQGLYALVIIYKRSEWKNNWKDNNFVNLIMAVGFSFLLYLPWLPAFMEQLQRVQGGYWIPPMDRWAIPGTVWKMVFGGQHIARPLLMLATVLMLIATFYFIRKAKETEKWLVVYGILIPFAAAIVLSIKNDIYLDRYFVFASLFVSILLAGALSSIQKAGIRRALIFVFIIISVAYFWKNGTELGLNTNPKPPGMAGASTFLNDRVGKNDRLYVGSSLIFFNFKYYNETGITPQLISGAPLEKIPHYAGTAIMTEQDLILDTELFKMENYKKNDTVWLLWTTGWGGSKPNVPGNWSKTSEQSWDDTPDFKGYLYVTQYRVE
jgi:uncharacterized membrane protein